MCFTLGARASVWTLLSSSADVTVLQPLRRGLGALVGVLRGAPERAELLSSPRQRLQPHPASHQCQALLLR